MAPSGRRRAKSTRKPRRTTTTQLMNKKKNMVDQSKTQENCSPAKNSNNLLKTSTEVVDIDLVSNVVEVDSSNGGGCSTPKAKRFQIPEIVTCPPAPKKRRVVTNNCSLRRTPIAFFAPPDLELFFVFALGRDILPV